MESKKGEGIRESMTRWLVDGVIATIIAGVIFVVTWGIAQSVDTTGWSPTKITMLLTVVPLALSFVSAMVVFVVLHKVTDHRDKPKGR